MMRRERTMRSTRRGREHWDQSLSLCLSLCHAHTLPRRKRERQRVIDPMRWRDRESSKGRERREKEVITLRERE
jgi:hypothetical protein